MKVFFLIFTFLLLTSQICKSQKIDPKSGWAIETSLTFPINNIYYLCVAHTFQYKNEILSGLMYQNWIAPNKTPFGHAHAYTLITGYRRFFWKGLNAEITLYPAYNNFKSYLDNKWYNGFEIWCEYRIGYKFKWTIKSSTFYLNVQPGIGHAWYLQNIWPSLNKNTYRTKSVQFIPQIAIGYKF